ncbi:MAG: hypothetical protein AB7S86_07860 [Hydrogenophaga sp.]|uniref:hypothetical protein n=1 Tax=Hydrogenophaga sp. TaxID=1904254 RepID=UPI003D128532
MAYQPSDTLYLWYLGRPEQPVLVGELNLVMSGRGVSLRYGTHWLRQGFALSEDLPAEKDSAAGAVDDARPDRWGERVIRLLERPPRMSLLELLYFTGDDRFGALGVSTDPDRYFPHTQPSLDEVEQVHALVRKVQVGAPMQEHARAPLRLPAELRWPLNASTAPRTSACTPFPPMWRCALQAAR